MAVIVVETAVKYSFAKKGIEMRQKGQYKAESTLFVLSVCQTADNCDNSYW